jgi:hypothetical protein
MMSFLSNASAPFHLIILKSLMMTCGQAPVDSGDGDEILRQVAEKISNPSKQ